MKYENLADNFLEENTTIVSFVQPYFEAGTISSV